MTVETFEMAKEIELSLHFISEDKKYLSLIEELSGDCVYLTDGCKKVRINRELAGKLIPIIKEYHQQQVEKLEKEFAKL